MSAQKDARIIRPWSRIRRRPAPARSGSTVTGYLTALMRKQKEPTPFHRCAWAGSKAYLIRYHDREWGRPVHNDRRLFEMLILEGAQAGLTWETILRKRPGYRKAFARFDPRKVARFTAKQRRRLLADTGIIRNRLKIDSTVTNARAFLAVQKEFGSFDRYVWGFVGGLPKINRRKSLVQLPASSPESDALSKDLKQRGFCFVGSTIVYAFMQAVGMVNDHTIDCFLAQKRRVTDRE